MRLVYCQLRREKNTCRLSAARLLWVLQVCCEAAICWQSAMLVNHGDSAVHFWAHSLVLLQSSVSTPVITQHQMLIAFFLLFTYLTWDFFPLLQPGVLLYFPFVCPSVSATTTTFLIWIKIGGVVENLLNFVVCTLSSVQSPQWV